MIASNSNAVAAHAERDAVIAGTQLEALITNYLLDERLVEGRLGFICEILASNALLKRCSGDAGNSKVPGTALAKWILRISALLQSRTTEAKIVGIHLASLTVRHGVHLETKQAKLWASLFMAYLNILVQQQQQQQQQQQGFLIRNVANAMLELLLVCVEAMELHKELVTPYAAKFCGQMLVFAENADIFPFALEIVAELARHFPGPTRTVCERAAHLCISHIDSDSMATTELRKRAAGCLPSLLIAGERTTNEADAWITAARQISAAIEDAIDLLVDQTMDNGPRSTLLTQPVAADDYPTRIPIALHRIRFFLDCLADMQCRSRAMPVDIPLEGWLQLARRLISVEAVIENRQIDWQERQMLVSVQSSLYTLTCRFIGQLIISLKQFILPYIDQLVSIILSTFTRTNDSQSRLAAYRICRLALLEFGVNAGQLIGSRLISNVEQDIEKHQRDLDRAQGIASGSLDASANRSTARDHPRCVYLQCDTGSMSSRVCQAGLNALYAFLTTSACILNADMRQKLDGLLFNHALGNTVSSLFMMSGGHSTRLAHLNHTALDGIRAEALKCMTASLASPYDTVQANVQACAINLYANGRNAMHTSIRHASIQGLQQSTLLLHPQLPPLMRPIMSPSTERKSISAHRGMSTATRPNEETIAMASAFEQLPALTKSSTISDMVAAIEDTTAQAIDSTMQMDILTNNLGEMVTTITNSKKRALDEPASPESDSKIIKELHKERKLHDDTETKSTIMAAVNKPTSSFSDIEKPIDGDDNDHDDDASIPDICLDSDSEDE